MAGAVAVLSFC